MYATVAAAAALHQVLLRSLGDDKVVVQNVASGLFCVLFVALGVAGRPTLLATTKKTWRGRPNPHDRGAFRNWLDFFFRATPSVVLEFDQVESRCEAA